METNTSFTKDQFDQRVDASSPEHHRSSLLEILKWILLAVERGSRLLYCRSYRATIYTRELSKQEMKGHVSRASIVYLVNEGARLTDFLHLSVGFG
jgi:hypothetical protein